ncbi:cysteine peptidase family C39 domain-containing protein [Gelidibacter gilvus]|uniref:cysteine peptidase family C39 domain-containing protein n=1 Tax=Gelidibacter gilvus TaxID=59602 RepID=UPI0021D285C7|nr:cysteine peptidase family C39 domain-containing protein [Gelidibacter gilvus]
MIFKKLKEAPLPLIVHFNNNHFITVYKIKNDMVFMSDLAYGLITYTKDEFISRWIGNNANESTKEGVALLLENTPKFKELDWIKRTNDLLN